MSNEWTLERLYLQVKDDEGNPHEEVTWCQDQINATDVEYVRADLLKELQEENEKLKDALHQDSHYIVFSESGWSVEHLVSCRPDMTTCEFHKAAQRTYGSGVVITKAGVLGRYKCTINERGGLLLEPLEKM